MGLNTLLNFMKRFMMKLKRYFQKQRVFCIFAREIISENREANLDVLKLFNPNKIDLLVLTSYQYGVQSINSPSDIPDDYYSKVSNYMPSKPFGVSEIAWPSLTAFGGEEAQTDFIELVTNRLIHNQGIKLELFGWSWLTDLNQNDAIGLIKIDGTEKLIFKKWKDLSGK